MTLGRVIASASMSLDGYIAKADNSIGRLFDWLQRKSLVNRQSGRCPFAALANVA
jgi:hypothetical protein